ncbi:MAG: hypothetical protein OEY78_13230, partial [Gammaproteobacteria bacterium]|nr:hypothetical protein [Gammaproteobacteria bacterium]
MDNKNSEEVNATKTISIYSLMFILILSSVVAITIRLFFIGNETLAGGDMLWRLSINATTRNIPHDTIIKVYPPFDTEYIRVIQRKVSHPGFKTRKSSEEEKYQRNINIIATDIGEHNIHTEYLVHVSQTAFTVPPINPELSTQKRESFLLDSERLQFKSYSVKELLKKLLQGQPDQDILVEKIYRFSKSIPIYKGKDTPNV